VAAHGRPEGMHGMGQEIRTARFRPRDFQAFESRLRSETQLLASWFDQERFAGAGSVAGFELEAWLVGSDCRPAAINEAFLRRIDSDWVSPELSRFNVELNAAPQPLRGAALDTLYNELSGTWNYCCEVAREIDTELVMIGILPSVREEELVLANMSQMKRYRALNEQVFRLRHGQPLHLDILGREHLRTTHYDVMLESATTSFQIHLQVDAARAVRYYNASLIASAATVAVGANSPYLFGVDLWDETRIPLFEQAVEVGGFNGAARGPLRRVGFGSGYVRESLLECYLENLEHFPVLLPMAFDTAPEQMDHLRLHNGTIWRWNRPLIGFEPDGRPHLRIEHRVVAGGPTIADMIANCAFYYGLVEYLANMPEPPEALLDFSRVRDNFYAGARLGLQASVDWLDDRRGPLHALVLEELLVLARVGLQRLDLARDDIRRYLGIVEARVRSRQTGAAWQRRYVAAHGRDMPALTGAYVERQHSGIPVHEWGV
jgi:hypothetical protein